MIKITCTKEEKERFINNKDFCPADLVDHKFCNGDVMSCEKCIENFFEWEIVDEDIYDIVDKMGDIDSKVIFGTNVGEVTYTGELTGENPLCNTTNNPVSHPSHYTDGKIEVVDFLDDKNLNHHLASAVEYICRAGKKDPDKYIEDLEKAVWRINHEIEKRK